MPFYRRWDRGERRHIIDRDLTGPPRPSPDTGTAQVEDGTIVGNAANQDIPPATPVSVTMPSPYEPVLDSRGVMNPRWWRFFEELYRRTGAFNDNINSIEQILGDSTTTVALVLTGNAPSISRLASITVGSIAITGNAPSIVVGQTVPLGSLTFTGNVPTVV